MNESHPFDRWMGDGQVSLKEGSYALRELLDPDGRAFIANAYRAILGREPDADGLRSQLDDLRRAQATKTDVLGRLRFSAEGRVRGVAVKGLFPRYLWRRAYRVPALGYALQWLTTALRLPSVVRRQDGFEARVPVLLEELRQHLLETESEIAQAVAQLRVEIAEPVAQLRAEIVVAFILAMACLTASRLRDQGKGRTVSFSPKVFVPLTQLCRDFCSYCTFRETPQQAQALYMTPEHVLQVVLAGERLGCREALFVLGERPEERYPEARRWLRDRGYDSTLEYLHEICKLTLSETALFPHSNAGNMTRRELEALREVNVSLGLMLENVSERLCARGGPHERAPSKHPQLRLETLRQAGELRIPFTTGLLIGIGETAEERTDSLLAIRDLHRQYGHIQEIIIQNFQAKARTPMRWTDGPPLPQMLETLAEARILLGPDMNIQAPPNLAHSYGPGARRAYLDAGINDWGGISPLTIDYVNPEAPWPGLLELRDDMESHGFQLRGRYPVYPEYILRKDGFLTGSLKQRLLHEVDPDGFIPGKVANRWSAPGRAMADSRGTAGREAQESL